jgi:hypothetical protein
LTSDPHAGIIPLESLAACRRERDTGSSIMIYL